MPVLLLLLAHLFGLLSLFSAGDGGGSGDSGGDGGGDGGENGDQEGGDEGDDLVRLKEALRKEREARRALDREIRPLRTFKTERENAERTAEERATAKEREVAEREQALVARERKSNLRDAIAQVLGAQEFGFTFREGVTTDRVIRLLDLNDDDWDGEKPKNVKRLLTDLQQSDGYLFAPKARRPGSADGGAGHQTTVGASMNDRIRHAAGRR